MNTPNAGLIAWFAKNPVAANLMMIFIIVAGVMSAFSISKEMFPRIKINSIQVTAVYPGAAPVEVEQGVILPIETALQGITGVKEIRSTASRDIANIELDVDETQDINEMLARVENRVNGIVNFPESMETPNISRNEYLGWVTGVSVSGPLDDYGRKLLGQQIRDELQELPEVKKVILWGVDDYEIAIEVREDRLQALDLTLSEVAQVLRESSLDLPAGMIRSSDGNILVRTQGKAYTGPEFENIVLRSNPDGTELRVADVAVVKDAFEESNAMGRFDRSSAVSVGVFALEDQNVLEIDRAVKAYIDAKRPALAEGLKIDQFTPVSPHLMGRLNMMLSNLAMGGILVAIVLTLFLNVQVASWVMLGIPVSFLGAFWLMPINPYPVTVNVISLFAFIMVLGIVVDDAIVIGESIYTEVQQEAQKTSSDRDNGPFIASIDTVVTGAKRVAIPSTIGVLTTIAAFAPMLFISGRLAGFQEAIAMVVVLCLLFSLIESKLILPSHLVGFKYNRDTASRSGFFQQWQQQINATLKDFVANQYQPFLRRCLHRRYTTLSCFMALLIIAGGTLYSGIAKFEFFPNVPSDDIRAEIVAQDGTSAESLKTLLKTVEAAAYLVDADYRQRYPKSDGLIKHVLLYTDGDVKGTFIVSLVPAQNRRISSVEFEQLWRQKVGDLPNVRKQRYFASTNAGGGAKINIQLSSADTDQLALASTELENQLAQYEGVFDIQNSQGTGAREIQIGLKPYASQIGVTLADVARQVRQAFYGEEVQRIQRGVDTVKVMVRYPLAARSSQQSLENLLIRTKSGEAIRIAQVAEITMGEGPSSISRTDRRRTVNVTADTDPLKVQSGVVIEDITENFVPKLLARYPGLKFDLGGSSKEEQTLMVRFGLSFAAAVFLIYGLLAVPLRSYAQPLVIMSVIPFGFVGALVGHIVFGVTMNMLSVMGLVALAGVVVNDSLILVEFANRRRAEGLSVENALTAAGAQRFRAILLTTLTTFVGLLPLLFETSMQAQFVIPMALSLSFGIVFATTITLILVPCCYGILDDSKQFITGLWVRVKAL